MMPTAISPAITPFPLRTVYDDCIDHSAELLSAASLTELVISAIACVSFDSHCSMVHRMGECSIAHRAIHLSDAADLLGTGLGAAGLTGMALDAVGVTVCLQCNRPCLRCLHSGALLRMQEALLVVACSQSR